MVGVRRLTTLLLVLTTQEVAQASVFAVSPGEEHSIPLADSACPTFSWGASDRRTGFELAVYGIQPDDSLTQEPALRQRLPAGVTTWTPNGLGCLRNGAYAWVVRALPAGTEPSPWSRPRMFEVAEPAATDFDALVERVVERVLRRLLDEERAHAVSAPASEDMSPAEPESRPPSERVSSAFSTSFIADAAEFSFPPCTEVPSLFADVPNDHPLCPFIKQFYADEITQGCAADPDLRFCPDEVVTRSHLAVYVERAMRGTFAWNVDADVLDGLDSTAFLQLAGGAMAGNINIQLTNELVDVGSGNTSFHPAFANLAGQLTVDENATFGDSPGADTATIDAALVANGNVTLGDSVSDTATIQAGPLNLPNATTAADALVLGGDTNLYRSAANVLRTDDSFLVAQNITLGNALGDTLTIAGTIQGASPLVFEGGATNGFETALVITDATADRTLTIPDATGEVSLLGPTIEGSEIDDVERVVNLPITAFLNCESDSPIDFSSGDDFHPDFALSRLYLEWDVDSTPDDGSVCTTFTTPADYVSNPTVRLVAQAGAAEDVWRLLHSQCPLGGTNCGNWGSSDCDGGQTSGDVYTCSFDLAVGSSLHSGDTLKVRVSRLAGSNPMRLYGIEFRYQASQ